MLNSPIGVTFQSAALSMNATPGRSLRIPSTLQLNIALNNVYKLLIKHGFRRFSLRGFHITPYSIVH